MLCATIKQENHSSIAKANRKADLIELRLDLFQPQQIEKLRALCKKPVIFTLKEVDFKLLELSPDYVDLPSTTDSRTFEEIGRRFPRIQRICSYHNFKETTFPHLSHPAELYKIVGYAHSTIDALKMLRFVREHRCLGLCMGEFGTVTRILAPLFGAPWTYAPIEPEQQTAPGQIFLEELAQTYRYRSLSPKTALYGLIGDPVSKSSGHIVHNHAFGELGLDAVYVKMRVKKEELSLFLPLCQEIGFRGLSVTMPLKERVLQNRAVNTLAFREGKLYGWNTDGVGALEALEKIEKVKGKKVVLLGAGGVAIGIAKEAKKRGAKLFIVNRTLSRAEILAKEVEGEALALEHFSQLAKRGYDILMNCTPVCPVSKEDLLENRLVMDVITKPRQTPLLIAAREKGCPTVEGIEMWIQQAIGQYEKWFGNVSMEN